MTNKTSIYDEFYAKYTAFNNNIINNKMLRFGNYEHGIILDFINADKGSKVLDYGCNTGYISRKIKDCFGCEVIGADINSKALAIARKSQIKTSLLNNKFLEKNKGRYDVVLCSHVLEHTQNPLDVLKNINSLLKENGRFVIAVPQERIRGDINSMQILYSCIKLKFENPHKHNFSQKDLYNLLKKACFKPRRNKFINFIPPFVTNDRRFLSRTLIAECIKL